MKVFLISSNPLFTETLSDSCLRTVTAEVLPVSPDVAPAKIVANSPEVVLVDEGGTSSEQLSRILDATRSLHGSRTVLLSLQNNDVVVLNAHRATIRKVEDLLETIQIAKEDCVTDLAAEARTRADAYGFLATLCNQRPDLDLVRRLRTLGVEIFLNQVDQENAMEDVRGGLEAMSAFIADMAGQSDEQVEQTLAVDWTRLFRGVSPAYGPPPPYEACFIDTGQTDMQVIHAMNQLYRSNGLAINDDCSERPDYIGLELSFLGHLTETEAQAWDENKADLAQSYRHMARLFLKEHLGAWIEKYTVRAIEYSKTGFYQGFLQLCQGVIAETAN